MLDIETGMQEVVGDFPGMTFAPRFSPDGKKIIMSFAKDGKSDIYTCLLYTSPSPRDATLARMPSSA